MTITSRELFFPVCTHLYSGVSNFPACSLCDLLFIYIHLKYVIRLFSLKRTHVIGYCSQFACMLTTFQIRSTLHRDMRQLNADNRPISWCKVSCETPHIFHFTKLNHPCQQISLNEPAINMEWLATFFPQPCSETGLGEPLPPLSWGWCMSSRNKSCQ